jgi:hypothetical protein
MIHCGSTKTWDQIWIRGGQNTQMYSWRWHRAPEDIDTSVWIHHFRHTDNRLVTALEGDEVLMHPFVIGELACGNLHARAEVLELLSRLPQAPKAADEGSSRSYREPITQRPRNRAYRHPLACFDNPARIGSLMDSRSPPHQRRRGPAPSIQT